ncbi:MAG: S-layer homology domain-containing protein [Candidatus Margulisbacteria bacterium]|nr:S-layer homology domain-containing protein [Candidatus Margulisiibacteriota bacterium]
MLLTYAKRIRFSCIIVFILFVSIFSASAQVWENIELIGVGAKSLALGSSGVAFLDDANAPYLNSAGLAGLKTIQLTSLYTKLLNEVRYNTLAVAVPSRFGVFGFNAVIASLSDINLSTSLVNGRPVVSGTAAYSSSQYSLSYAKQLDQLFALKNLSIGATAKYIARNFSGLPASYEAQGSAAGFDMDLGIQWTINDVLNMGVSQHNFLPHSLGGKLTWASGYTESIPTFTKLGVACNLLETKLLFSLDSDFYLTEPDYPIPVHIGLQYTPLPLFSLRAGYDENLASGGAANTVAKAGNFCGGIGLQFGNFIFDYAYHPYYQEDQSVSHYFTISFIGPLTKPTVPLPVAVSAAAEPIVVGPIFTDLDQVADLAVRQLIIQMAAKGYFKGFPDGTFRPRAELTNAQFITVIVRIKKLPAPAGVTPHYKNLSASHWAAPFVTAAEDAAILRDGSFNPNQKVSLFDAYTILEKAFALKNQAAFILNETDLQKNISREDFVKILSEVGINGQSKRQ